MLWPMVPAVRLVVRVAAVRNLIDQEILGHALQSLPVRGIASAYRSIHTRTLTKSSYLINDHENFPPAGSANRARCARAIARGNPRRAGRGFRAADGSATARDRKSTSLNSSH